MLEERRSLGGYGCRIKGGFDVSWKTIIVADINYVAQPLTTRNAQWPIRSVLDQNLLGVMIYNVRK